MSQPYWPFYEEDEIQAVVEVLKSGKVNYWTGQKVKEFEASFADYMGCQYGVAVANGTLALELALVALDISEGDEVITTPRTFLASASSIMMRGAKPVFADIDKVSQLITADTIAAKITSKTKAIICVHLAGWPCEMDKIMALAKKHHLVVIEDCAQAHGAEYKGQKVGSFGHMAAFSFCQDKIMSTGGEGGMVVTNNESLWQKAWSYKDHGKDYNTVFNVKHPDGFRWLHQSLGTNWRLTEMQAAIGLKQLSKLSAWLEVRRQYADLMNNAFSTIKGIRVSIPTKDISHAYYKYYFNIEPDALKADYSRDRIMQEINSLDGLQCRSGGCSEVYREKVFSSLCENEKRLSVAKELGDTSLSVLLAPTLEASKIHRFIESVQRVMIQATI